MSLLQFCYIVYFQLLTTLLSVGRSSSRSISAVKNAHFGTNQPHQSPINGKNSVLATYIFFVTIVTFYIFKIVKYNSSKAFSHVTKYNKPNNKNIFVTFCYNLVTFCYINLLHFVTYLINYKSISYKKCNKIAINFGC